MGNFHNQKGEINIENKGMEARRKDFREEEKYKEWQ